MNWLKDFLSNGIKYEVRPDGTCGSILKYDPKYATSVGWLIPRRGSVFTLLEMLILVGTVVLFCTILGLAGCPYKNRPGCIYFPSPSTGYLTLLTLCSFVVAFFANTVLNRWWTVRQSLQGGFGGGTNLIMNLCGLLSAEITSAYGNDRAQLRETAHLLTSKIISYLILSHRLLFLQSKEIKAYDDLVIKGHLNQDEYQYFCSLDGNPVHPLSLISSLLQQAARMGLLGGRDVVASNLKMLINDLSSVRSSIGTVSLNINTQMPYPFVQLISATCHCFMVQLIYVCSAYISYGLASDETVGKAALTTGYLTIITYAFVLFGLLRIFDMMGDPLGDDGADFPGYSYMESFEKNMLAIRNNTLSQADDSGLLGAFSGFSGPALANDETIVGIGCKGPSATRSPLSPSTPSKSFLAQPDEVCASLQSRGIDTIGELLEAMGVDGADAQGLFSETGFKNSHPTALFVQTFKEVLTKYPDEFIIQVRGVYNVSLAVASSMVLFLQPYFASSQSRSYDGNPSANDTAGWMDTPNRVSFERDNQASEVNTFRPFLAAASPGGGSRGGRGGGRGLLAGGRGTDRLPLSPPSATYSSPSYGRGSGQRQGQGGESPAIDGAELHLLHVYDSEEYPSTARHAIDGSSLELIRLAQLKK